MIAVVLVGFVMITLGGALLILGEVPFLAGKRISAWRGRLIGVVLMLFLPLAFGARIGISRVLGDEAADGLVVTWILCGVCWLTVAVILFRVIVPKKEKGEAKAAKKNPFTVAPPLDEPEAVEDAIAWTEPEPEPEPEIKPITKKTAAPPKKAVRKPVEENPFDFS